MLSASVALLPAASVARSPTATDLNLWVFVDRRGAFEVKRAEAWNQANPDRPSKLTYETTTATPCTTTCWPRGRDGAVTSATQSRSDSPRRLQPRARPPQPPERRPSLHEALAWRPKNHHITHHRW